MLPGFLTDALANAQSQIGELVVHVASVAIALTLIIIGPKLVIKAIDRLTRPGKIEI